MKHICFAWTLNSYLLLEEASVFEERKTERMKDRRKERRKEIKQ
jgi:hypothetical protein